MAWSRLSSFLTRYSAVDGTIDGDNLNNAIGLLEGNCEAAMCQTEQAKEITRA
jgi:hypothetical protein